MSGLLPLEEAHRRLLALAQPGAVEWITAEAAVGRYLAVDLRAARTQPPADLSAMDGYAIAGGGPWRLAGESRAGAPFPGRLGIGECVRISTGAYMPIGADRVLIRENASFSGETVSAAEMPNAAQHVRRQGFDFAEDDVVLKAGVRIGPGQLALALAAGHDHLPVHAVPKVAVLDSGDELARDPSQCGPHQIPASNGAMLAAMLKGLTPDMRRIGPVADDLSELASALAGAEDVDILITSGGASVGDHDLVQQALVDWGAEIAYWKVAIKPGKPLMVATRARADGSQQVVLGLPGNPVSSFVTGFLFALPLIRAVLGSRDAFPRSVRMELAEPLPATGSRREFLRGVHERANVRPAGSQDSSALVSLASANCVIVRPEDAAEAPIGSVVDVLLL